MKRFWQSAAKIEDPGGWSITLDDRSLKTPGRATLVLPSDRLADAIVDEWNKAGADFDPRAMPLTGLANAAVDRVATDRATFAAGLSRYAEADLLCYRSEAPQALVARQAECWDPLLDWARRRFDVDFVVTAGVAPVTQRAATIERLSHAVGALDSFRLAGLSPLVTIGGSLVVALALLEDAVTVDQAWSAVTLDERWQAEHWGVDADAAQVLAGREHDFAVGKRFLELLATGA